ncbi:MULTISPECIES: DUF3775 domain-containing protein [unclassified Sporosarcina]|uniref:DUF3775 domain-containing protein n=1 Tax=unclassified Sporosarcina TaxID=2647733 RepID=UPI00203B1C64|nr:MULTISPECIES: DUF3775 domain-containing protein [unclassified Sporosarcina]GKV65906.1 hypothetical protein NCCP2331_20590 [Sporosarcina sp. NCCP-2331]GLB56094.1 hypothetical protein NCCP2378_18810 [Sporosarcina sp. NCCP-2378]
MKVYYSARRVVQGMMMSAERKVILLDMITFAKERRKLTVGEGIMTLSGATGFYDSESQIEEWEMSRKMYEYLMRLSFEDVKFVQTVMYMGRDETLEDGGDAVSLYNEVYSSLSWTAQDVEAEMIVEKMPLDEYLSRGLELMAA